MQKTRNASPYFMQFVTAINSGDCATLRALVEAGADINELDEYGTDSAFFTAVDALSGVADGTSHPANVLDAVRLALALGANPYPTHFSLQQFNAEGQLGILSGPILENDLELAAILLQSGVDPNWTTFRLRELHAPKIYSLFSEAEQRYTDLHYGYTEPLPEPYSAIDEESSAAWVDYLDRMAIRQGVQRPDVLYLLHNFGARNRDEIAVADSGSHACVQRNAAYGMFIAVASCIGRNDFEALEKLLRVGGDLNAVSNYDPEGFTLYEATPVSVAINWLCQPSSRYFEDRLSIVSKVFALGVDPNLPRLMDDNLGLLWPILWHQDAEMMTILLRLGAGPNRPRGYEGDTIFDNAVDEYLVTQCHQSEVHTVTNGALTAIDLYARCERFAVDCNAMPPCMLKVLLDHGALTGDEMLQQKVTKPDA